MRPALLHIWVAVLVLSATFLAAEKVGARDLQLKPTLAVGEEYTDNIFETADGRKTEFTTRVRPGLAVGYLTPFLGWDSSYVLDYRTYARKTHGDELVHNLDLRGTAELIDHFLYIEVTDALHRTTLNVSRDLASESLLVNQTTQNIATVSPYLVWRPSDKGTIRTGYRYGDTRYWEGAGIERREHAGFAEIQHYLTSKFSLYASYTYTRNDTSIQAYDSHDAIGGFKYDYGDNSSIFGKVGNSWQSFSGGSRTSNLLWDAGISHDFRIFTALLETKVQEVQDPLSVSTRQITYMGNIDKTFKRAAAGLSGTYEEYYFTQSGILEHRRASITGSGNYELFQRVTASAAVTAERFSHQTLDDYPYRLTASTALNYGFWNDVTAFNLSYSYRLDRQSFHSGGRDRVTNKVLLEIRTGI